MDPLVETISILKANLRHTIESLQFQKARELDKSIAALQLKLKAQRIASRKQSHSREFEVEKELLRQRALELQADYQQQLVRTRNDFEIGACPLHKDFANEMDAITLACAKAIELEATRPIPEALELLREARLQAQVYASYTLAEAKQFESGAVAAESVARREAEIRRLYDAKQTNLRERHAIELSQHEQRLQTEITLLRLRFRQEQQVLRQAYGIYATKFGIPWTPADVDAFFAPYNLRDIGERQIGRAHV
jgi:hypothetical protein